MQQLVYELRQLCKFNRDGSYVTQANREDILTQMGEQLISLGYKQLHAGEIKGRHVNKLMGLWREQGLNDQTIRNRLSMLRWLCHKVGRPSVMPKTNAVYQLAPRPQAALVSKAITLDDDILAQVDDPYVRMSFELQRAYGLRRKECIMLTPWLADQGTVLFLQRTWTKGKRERAIPLTWPEQRDVLDRAKQLVRFKSHSLIPQDLFYYQQRNRYCHWARKLGLPPLHGLRHNYACRRYADLTGWAAPVAGGPSREALTPEQQQQDRAARQQISRDLGHERLAIVALYIGV